MTEKFKKKPAVAEANIKVVAAGYDYGHNVHASVPNTYRIETKEKVAGRYMDITGNKATAYGLMAAAEKAGFDPLLGFLPYYSCNRHSSRTGKTQVNGRCYSAV